LEARRIEPVIEIGGSVDLLDLPEKLVALRSRFQSGGPLFKPSLLGG
jgi:hypothetical protein